MGDETPRLGDTEEVYITGEHGEGPSRRETILTAAQRGFATRAYREVYADYRRIVEEVMNAENIPTGYKYYVRRYFQMINPHNEGE